MSFLLFLMASVVGAESESDLQPIVVPDAQVKLISEVRVPARDAGVLSELKVTEGELVKKGQSLGVIDDRLIRLENESAKLEHEIARLQSENDVDERYALKSLEVAKSELKRSAEANQLYQDSVSLTEIERLRMLVDRSTLSIEQSQRDRQIALITEKLKKQSIQSTDLRIVNRRIESPLEGMIIELNAQEGEWLEPGTVVLRVIKLDRLRVEAHVDGRQYGRELEGCPVELAVRLPPGNQLATFKGTIVFVSPEVQPVTNEIRVWAEVQNKDLRLRPGDNGTLTINPPVTKQ